MTWHPADPELDHWLEIYRLVARRMGGEPDAGRRLKSWAVAAGLTGLTCTASVWCFADPADLAWWTETWAERISSSELAGHARDLGVTQQELDTLAAAWRRWGEHPDAWFSVLHSEVLAVG